MLTIPGHQAILRYVAERRCNNGGYCFYRLDEPNAGDTRYALSVLHRLGTVRQDPPTVAFLQSLQRTDGSFPNIFVAEHALTALALLGAAPFHDPRPHLLGRLRALEDLERPPEQASALEGIVTAVEACRMTGTPIEPATSDAVLRYVRLFRHPGGGFGAGRPTIAETTDAVRLLAILGRPEWAAKSEAFVADAEQPSDGQIYIEAAAAFIRAALLLRYRPRSPAVLRSFVIGLRHPSGGFVRSRFGGSPTLEYTHLAVEALAQLDELMSIDGPSLREQAERCP